MRHLGLLLALAACGEPGLDANPTAPMALSEPAPPGFDLDVGAVLPGQTLTLRASGVTAGATVYFFRGGAFGPGLCAPGGTPCLDITDTRLLGTAVANGAGTATLSGVVPSSMPFDRDHWFQAMSSGSLQASGVVARSNTEGCTNPANLAGLDLSHVDLFGLNLGCADLSGADLQGVDLRGADLFAADLSGAWLDGADLEGVHGSFADLSDASLRGAHLTNADLTGARLDRTDLRFSYGTGLDLEASQGVDTLLSQTTGLLNGRAPHARLTRLDASFSVLTGWQFTDSSLVDLNADEAVLDGANLQDADLDGASMIGTSLRGTTLNEARFTHVTVRFADLTNASMLRTIFSGSTFEDSSLVGASGNTVYRYDDVLFRRVNATAANVFFSSSGTGTVTWDACICPNGLLSNDPLANCSVP